MTKKDRELRAAAAHALKTMRIRVLGGNLKFPSSKLEPLPFRDTEFAAIGPLVALAGACGGNTEVMALALSELDRAHTRVGADRNPVLQDVAEDAIVELGGGR
jgi:hypothetical protein